MTAPSLSARGPENERQRSADGLVDVTAWKYLHSCYPGKIKVLLAYGAMAAAQSLLVLPALYLIRQAFDVSIPAGDVQMLLLVGCGIFGIRLLSSAVSLWLRAAHIRLIKEAVQRLREDLLLRLFAVSRSFYTNLDRNTTHAQIVQDTERLDNMSYQLVSRVLPALFTGVVLLFVLASLNIVLLLVMLILGPVLLLASRLTGRIVKHRVFVFQRSFERFSKGMMFVLQHMDLTRVQSFEDGEIARRTEDLEELNQTGQRMSMIFAVHGQLQSTIVGICGIVILVIGGAAVSAGSMTLGEFMSFWVAAGLLNGQVTAVTGAVPQLIAGNESMVTLHRLAHLGERRPYNGSQRLDFDGTIELQDVSFDYGHGDVLTHASLTMTSHSNIAIVGPNGSGKSTILYLILGFYRPVAGRVLASGVPYDDIDLVEMRRSIGVVMQHPTFFSGTILENIGYGHADASRDDIVQAARLSLADDFIRRLPSGYDTPVGEEGVLLSGGEAQRVAIARALLRRPKLLVLDEPTNHLDRSVIARFMQNLDALEDRPGVITISHDREVVGHAERVYRLTDGRLEEQKLELSGQRAG